MNALVFYLCALLIVYSTHYINIGSVSFSLVEVVFYACSLLFLAYSFVFLNGLAINRRLVILIAVIFMHTLFSLLTGSYIFSLFSLATIFLMIVGELLSLKTLQAPTRLAFFLKILKLGSLLLAVACFIEFILLKFGFPMSIFYSPYLFQRAVGLNQQFGQYSGFLREPSFLGVLVSPSITLFSFKKEKLFSSVIIASVVLSGSSLAFVVLISSFAIKYFAFNYSFLSKLFFKNKIKKNIFLFSAFFACCLLFVLTNSKFNQRLELIVNSQLYLYELLRSQIDPSILIKASEWGSVGKLLITFYASFQTFIDTNFLGSGFGNWRYILPQALSSVDKMPEISLGGSSLLIRLLGEIGIFSNFIYIITGFYFFTDIARLHLLLFVDRLNADHRKMLLNLLLTKIWALSVIIGYYIRKVSYFDPLFVIAISILVIEVDKTYLPVEKRS